MIEISNRSISSIIALFNMGDSRGVSVSSMIKGSLIKGIVDLAYTSSGTYILQINNSMTQFKIPINTGKKIHFEFEGIL